MSCLAWGLILVNLFLNDCLVVLGLRWLSFCRCFVDSRKTMSSFQPRQRSSEIRLYLQAFAFALGKEVLQITSWCIYKGVLVRLNSDLTLCLRSTSTVSLWHGMKMSWMQGWRPAMTRMEGNVCIHPHHHHWHLSLSNTILLANSWELLDDPAQSSLCDCCDYGGDYGCNSRKRRALGMLQPHCSIFCQASCTPPVVIIWQMLVLPF